MTTLLTEQERAERLFEQYRSRLRPEVLQVPEPLQEGAPMPDTWPYPAESWAEFAEAARQHLKGKAEYDFAYAVAVRGFTPLELACGKLSPGSEVNLVTGQVRRPLPSTLDPETEARAGQVLRDLRLRNLSLDAPLMQALEWGSSGAWTSQPRMVRAAIREGTMRIEAHDRERRAAAAEEEAKPLLVVLFDFRAMRREYHQGERRRIGPQEDGDLLLWWDRILADAKRRDQDPPECPFEI